MVRTRSVIVCTAAMQSPPSPTHTFAAEPPPPPPPPPPFSLAAAPRRQRVDRGTRGVVPLAVVAIVLGVLLGGRASAEDGRAAASAALSGGDPAQAVSLDEDVAGRSGFLMVLDPGASAAAENDAQVARISWAKQLATSGAVDSAVAVLALVRQPSLIAPAALARAQILIGAASAAIRGGHAELALRRLDQATQGGPPSSLVPPLPPCGLPTRPARPPS
jgi:hypothetical protein